MNPFLLILLCILILSILYLFLYIGYDRSEIKKGYNDFALKFNKGIRKNQLKDIYILNEVGFSDSYLVGYYQAVLDASELLSDLDIDDYCTKKLKLK